ncbi:SDR family oxidoreductase [Polyangium aurulentum]|uniref:SDR family oxidoreductase n=1 Tax=Polyangium aurulentum TaxID=2567896 RepID=UPI0010AE4050|nr:SDR family oxidoreductase [Polyangium aurulentum]UQA58984.1 SDR family oxidoreductase [Polyangium aurulentum]
MPRPGSDAVLLVNGFPSLYARRLVEHALAEEPRAFVYLIVPADKSDEAEEAIEELGAARARVAVLEGDPCAMDLGLSGAEFRQLSREVDLIHHAVHASWVGIEKETATRLNRTSAAEILELGRAAGSLERLVFHSTTAVAGDRTGIVYEDDLDHHQSFRDASEETRMQAEAMARRAMRDVPISVVRAASVVGASAPSDRLDHLHLLALLVLATPAELSLPLPKRGDTPIHTVPMSYVARASHAIGRARGTHGRTYHLVDPHPLSARRFFEVLARSARRPSLGSIPSSVAGTLLRTPGIERFARNPVAFVEQLASAVRFDARGTFGALGGTGIECPPFETYVELLVAEVEQHVRARRMRRESTRPLPEEPEVDDPLS